MYFKELVKKITQRREAVQFVLFHAPNEFSQTKTADDVSNDFRMGASVILKALPEVASLHHVISLQEQINNLLTNGQIRIYYHQKQRVAIKTYMGVATWKMYLECICVIKLLFREYV